ncbi:putative DNA-binding domain-containing protein [Hydrogenophaga sp. RWCD_12]|uniref:HvfC/BufC family peptide modification chaperone n=1 Tax=Hydrogenophaga sp. RWCD_12 TaxID=3391190 RepID=UPI003984FDE6
MTLDELANLQEAFAAQLYCREPILEKLTPWLKDDRTSSDRFTRYADSLRHHHERSLKLVYPVLHALVGAGFFRMMSHNYGDMYPSRDADLGRFGRHLPEFIARLPSVSSYPYLGDVARLEWLVHEVHGAADVLPLRVDDLRSASEVDVPERWPLRLCPGAVLYESAWRTAAIWQAHVMPDKHDLPDLVDGITRAVVFRSGWIATVRETDASEWAALKAFEGGATLVDALATAQDQFWTCEKPENTFDPAKLISIWLSDGLLTSVHKR